MFRTTNVVYDTSEKTSATVSGGVGAAHVLAKRLGLTRAIDVQHAVRAVTLAPKEGAAMFALERAMEGLIDAGGTLLAIAAAREEQAEDEGSE